MKLYNNFFLIAMGCTILSACSDMDNMDSEGFRITSEQIEQTNEIIPSRVESSLVGMYHYMGTQYAGAPTNERDDDFGYPTACISQDLNGADMVCDNSGYNWFTVSSDYSDRNDTYANPLLRYSYFYNQLKLANDVLASVDQNTENEKLKQYIGEAKAIRAFDYLCLAPYFQFNYESSKDKPCIPLVTETTEDFKNNPRATVEQVYTQIITDLTDAIDKLGSYDRKGDKTRIDKQVAYGLRARAYLYMGKWAEAAADAAKALEGYTPYSREEVSTPAFYNINDHNWIWGISITANDVTKKGGNPSWPSHLGSFSGSSYTAAVGVYKRINTLLYNQIPNTDIRKQWWVDENLHSDLLNGQNWGEASEQDIPAYTITDVKMAFVPYTNVKFGMKSGIGSATNDCDWCIMRAEEMILIEAEGLAMSQQEGAAKSKLEDFVRTYRDPKYICNASTKEALQNEIWKQRRIELWGEGFAMADIMRLNKPIVRFHGTDKGNWPDAFCFNVEANDPYLLLRIPQKETNNNSAIENNTGGNKPVSMQNPDLKDGITD